MSNILFLSDVRISFPNIVNPQVQKIMENGQEKVRESYNAEFLMPANHPGFAQFYKAYTDLMTATFAENAGTVMQMIQADRKLRCFGQGEEKINKKTFKPYDGYAGNVYLTAGSKDAPQIIQADGTPVDPVNTMARQQLARKIYGGCRVNAAVKIWPQKNKYGNGIRLDLVAVQFLKDDTAFGEGAPDVTGMFGAVQQAAPAFAPQVQMPAAPFAAAVPTAPVFAQAPAAPQMPWQ